MPGFWGELLLVHRGHIFIFLNWKLGEKSSWDPLFMIPIQRFPSLEAYSLKQLTF